jgi:hypothetical protein
MINPLALPFQENEIFVEQDLLNRNNKKCTTRKQI